MSKEDIIELIDRINEVHLHYILFFLAGVLIGEFGMYIVWKGCMQC